MDDEEVPRGFRFYPTEEELVSFYLNNKLNATTPEVDRIIPLVDIYDHNPSDLPRLGGHYSPAEGEQWFFFSKRQDRESRGGRPNRLTKWGYWKATGSPADVYSSRNRVIGRKRTMVFYVGRAPCGTKTPWKMIEYKAFSGSPPRLREELCLCRIYKRSKTLRTFDRRPPSSVVQRNEARVSSSPSGDSATVDPPRLVESGAGVLPEKPNDGCESFWECARLNWFDLLSND